MMPLEIEYAIDRLDRQMDLFGESMSARQWNRLHKARKALLEALVVSYERLLQHD